MTDDRRRDPAGRAPQRGRPGAPHRPRRGAHPPRASREEPRRRLHPLSPLLHGAKSVAIIVVALSWQTLSQVGLERFALVVGVIAVAVVLFSLVGWLNTGYHVVGRELRIQDGLLWRRNRAIPLERLQSVEVRRPLLAQLTGLAELRLEVVGGGKTEAPLAYLTVRDAAALRERLLALAGRTAPGRRRSRRTARRPRRPARPPWTARSSGSQPGPADQPAPHPAGVLPAVRRRVRGGAVRDGGRLDLHRHRQHGHRDGRCAAAAGPAGAAGLGLPAGPRRRRPAGRAVRAAGDAQPGGPAEPGPVDRGDLAAAVAREGLAAPAVRHRRVRAARSRTTQSAPTGCSRSATCRPPGCWSGRCCPAST